MCNFFEEKNTFRQKHNSEKSGKKSKTVEKNYVNNHKNGSYFLVKKCLVENLVENVENSMKPMKNPFLEENFTIRESNFLRDF